MDYQRELDENILITEAALLETANLSMVSNVGVSTRILLGGELALLVRSHESRRQPECAQAQSALGASAHIVDQRHCLLVQLLLVEELVLDRVQVDEVAHACAHVPANIVRVHVHLPEELDHLILVRGVRLCARGRRCEVRGVVLVATVVAIAVLCGDIDSGEGECVGDLKSAIYVHAHERASRWCREGRAAVFDHFENDLRGVSG